MQKTITITGTGKVSTKPDIVIIRFPMSKLDYDYEDAIKELNQSVAILRGLLAKRGLDKELLKTTDFSVKVKHKYNDKTNEYDFKGYEASHDLKIELPFEQETLNQIITAISVELPFVNFSINFKASNSEELTQKVLENAVANATQSANTIAKASGVKLKEIIKIDYSFSEVQFITRRFDSEAIYSEASDSMPDINPEDVSAEKNITMIWEIE